MNQLRTIIVDDTEPIRTELKMLLAGFQIQVVGEASTVDEAIRLIEDLKPDLIFLDIQLKGETGFDLLEKANISAKIIFITAYDQYAIRAFEVNALDYLLKPISKDRLSKAIARLLPSPQKDVGGPQAMVAYNDVIYVMIDGSLKFIKVALLKCVIAEGKYSYIIYGKGKKELVSKTLHEWEGILPEKYFARIHRSTIVNFEYVEKVKKCKNYTHEVYVSTIDAPFTMSRRYAAKLKHRLTW